MKLPFVDLHCHPTLKPYSRSFKKPPLAGKNSADVSLERSIWHKDKANGFRRLLNTATSLTKFTQADFTTFYRGGGRVMLLPQLRLGLRQHILNGWFLRVWLGC